MKNGSRTCVATTRQNDPEADDSIVIARQLGRRPLTAATPLTRCKLNRPVVVVNPPFTDDGKPFPTLYWLTCPVLVERVSRLEAVGLGRRLEQRIALDAAFRAEFQAAQRRHVEQRRALAPANADTSAPHFDCGIAGSGKLLAVKCLHAHYADFLAAGDNPVGRILDGELSGWTCDRDCAS